MRVGKISSKLYKEDELAVAVWMNQDASRQSRRLETLTTKKSRLPLALPVASLLSNPSWASAVLVDDPETLFDIVRSSDRLSPIIVPLPVAKAAFGWGSFYIPEEFEDV